MDRKTVEHEAKEQRAGEIGTSQNHLEYFGTPESAEIFSSNPPDTCSIADVDRGRIFCGDVPQDYTTERQYIFTVMKLLLYPARASPLCLTRKVNAEHGLFLPTRGGVSDQTP